MSGTHCRHVSRTNCIFGVIIGNEMIIDVTCHCINFSWQIGERVLAISTINIDHLACDIFAKFSLVLADYFLMNKVFCVII